MARDWALDLACSLLPQSCVLCGAGGGTRQLCDPCNKELPRLPARRCAVCALPLPTGAVCGACLDRPPHFAGIEAPFRYEFPLTGLIQSYKYGGRLAHARLLGSALAAVVRREVDVAVAMPLTPARLAERGFNQALELARIACATLKVPLLPQACRKVTDTPPQAALPWKERVRNVRRVFACDADLTGMRVAVVDDVMTTGATLNEVARVLRRAGAAEVVGWVAARTLPR